LLQVRTINFNVFFVASSGEPGASTLSAIGPAPSPPIPSSLLMAWFPVAAGFVPERGILAVHFSVAELGFWGRIRRARER
jgi:hypothetical protein